MASVNTSRSEIKVFNERVTSQSVSTLHKYQSVAVGGTFDHIHLGHKALLQRAFEVAELVFIGLTSDRFVALEGKKTVHDFGTRKIYLEEFLSRTYPGRRFVITALDSKFGAGIFTENIEAIVVSAETLPNVDAANKKRSQMGLPKMKIEIVPMVLASDGKRISSTRIRAGEINSEGNPI